MSAGNSRQASPGFLRIWSEARKSRPDLDDEAWEPMLDCFVKADVWSRVGVANIWDDGTQLVAAAGMQGHPVAPDLSKFGDRSNQGFITPQMATMIKDLRALLRGKARAKDRKPGS